ncbi:MAG: polysaccharide biosynthesis tyrosine autokinase [Microbacteriaceae bacterium]|nr:polysaccharide biosynthesis tyrosine autokinase [Microbacteriaceae bacterium]
MTIAEFLRTLRANWLLLLLAVVLGAGAGFGYSMTLPRVYVSQSTGFVVVGTGDESVGSVIAGSQVAQDRARSYLPLFNSRSVAEEVAELSTTGIAVDEVTGALTAGVDEGTNLIRVSARSGSPEKAQEMANLALQATANVVDRIEGSSTIRVVPLEDAGLPGSPSSPNVRNLVLYGALIGLALALAFAFLRRSLDVRIRSTDDLEAATGSGLLGVLPKADEFKAEQRGEDRPNSPGAEAVRQLRTNLRFVSIDDPPRTIMITSANPGEGKSTVASALARSFARSGQPTLLIDADLRKPRQTEVFGIDGKVGLTQVLSGQAKLDAALHRIDGGQLYVLPAGRVPPNPSELLGSTRMAKLLGEAGKHFFVVVDAPPILPVTDATLLSTSVDGAVLVGRQGCTTKEQADRAAAMLERVGGDLLGVVLNGAATGGANSTYYGYGYGDYVEGGRRRRRRGDAPGATDYDERAGEAEVRPAGLETPTTTESAGAPAASAGTATRSAAPGQPRPASADRPGAGTAADAPAPERPASAGPVPVHRAGASGAPAPRGHVRRSAPPLVSPLPVDDLLSDDDGGDDSLPSRRRRRDR